jgi:hypothetical protein
MVEELNKENGRLGEKNEKLNRKVKKVRGSEGWSETIAAHGLPT